MSMKNMLASIPFDPYNSPKSFPSSGGGGGGGGVPGPPGPAGADGAQGAAGGIENYGGTGAFGSYPNSVFGTLDWEWPGYQFLEASGQITIDASTLGAFFNIFIHGFLMPGANQDESIQWLFRTYLQETEGDFSTIIGRSWAHVTPTDDFVPITHVASFNTIEAGTYHWDTRAIVDHEDAGAGKYPLLTEYHVMELLIPQVAITWPWPA